MSYNIDNVEVLTSEDFGATRAAIEAMDRLEGYSAEGNFIDELLERLDGCADDFFPLDVVEWYGEGSGNSFDKLKAAVALCSGSADLLLTWEGGDSHQGLRLKDGTVTQHKVVFALGDEEA